MIRFLKQFLNYSRFLSLDIVAGALAVSFYFSKLVNTSLPTIYWPALAVAVWIIYLTDHIADSLILSKSESSDILLFFQKYRKIILLFVLFLVILFIIILTLVPASMILFGFAGGLLVLIYLIVNQVQNRYTFIFPRELIISLLYVYGTCGYPIVLSHALAPIDAIFCAGIFLLTLTNVLIYSYYEYEKDRVEGVKSLAVRLSKEMTCKSAFATAVLGGLVFILLLIRNAKSFYFSLTGLIMSLILFSIILFKRFYSQKKMYGIVADLTFLLPWVVSVFL